MKKLSFVGVAFIACLLTASSSHASAKGDTTIAKVPDASVVIEMKVSDLKQYGESELVVELEPKTGSDYILPVVIGSCEITGIYEQTHKLTSPRPLTYDLMKNILDAASIKPLNITITKLEGGVYYALITLDDNGKKLEIDSRPSDAINLALRYNAPIFVANDVFEEAKERKQSAEAKDKEEGVQK